MQPNEIVNLVTLKSIELFGDTACKKFYAELKNKKFVSTKCKQCEKVFFPPREFCPECLSKNIEWVDLPKTAELYAFSQQEKAFRFNKPDVVGLVHLEGNNIRLIARINAPMEKLQIGMKLKLSFYEVDKDLVLIEFVIPNP